MAFLRLTARGLPACLLLLVALFAAATHASAILDLCETSICENPNVAMVPPLVAEVCEACGNYWGSLPGFTYCCRCNEKVFNFCYVAVLGGK